MGLVTNLTKALDVPHDPGQKIVIRKLSWKQLQRAADAKSDRGLKTVRDMGGEIYAAIQQARADATALQAAARDPLNLYDVEAVLRDGIVSWTYGEFTKDAIDDLDRETAEWAARQILAFSAPQTEADRKNG